MYFRDKIVDGKIYLLRSSHCSKYYIGSTTVSLEERLSRHIESFDSWLSSNFESDYLSSYEILKYGDYVIELLEDCPQISGWDLELREQHHIILHYKDVLNIIIPGKGIINRPDLTDTDDIYVCICGREMRNRYRYRRNHCYSSSHRKFVRGLHLSMISTNPDFEIIEVDIIPPLKVIHGKEGITLNIDC